MSVHGTARFATRDELRRAGLIQGRPSGEFPEALMVGWWFADARDFEPLEYGGDLHQLIVGGTGGGKFTTALAPMLLGSSMAGQTVVVVDPKGEIAKLAGPYFQVAFAAKQSVHLLDPWDQCGTGQTDVLNVLEHITPDNPNYVDDARALADSMIIPSGGENTHWDNAARNFLTAMLLYVAISPKEANNRDLIRVREIVALTWQQPKAYPGPKRPTLSALLWELLESDIAEGAVKHGVSSLLNREDKERSGIISSIDRDTSWIDSPQMKKVLRGKSLDLTEAARGEHKYFIVLPPDFFMTHRAWLRLMVTAFAKAFKRTLPDPKIPPRMRWRHIVIDEFANLGEMSFILNDIAVARGFDVKYHLAIQDLSQLARVYDKGWESFINNSFQRFFAISDLFTADYVSRMLGAATAESQSVSLGTSGSRGTTKSFTEGTSTGKSISESYGNMSHSQNKGASFSVSEGTSDSSGWSDSRSYNQVQRSLRTPDEVRRLDYESQFLFFRGMHPVECWRPAYWELFPSLPKFTIKEILGTVGRRPRDNAELLYFTRWRDQPLLLKPDAPSIATPLLPPPQTSPGPEPYQLDYRKVAIAALAVLILVITAWTQFFSSAPAPAPVVIEVKPPASLPERPAPNPAQKSVAFKAPSSSSVPSTAPAADPAPSAQVAAVIPTPARPVHIRPPVPNSQASGAMPRGDATRDYFLNLIRIQIPECATGHGKAEHDLIENLIYWATVKALPVLGQGATRVPEEKRLAAGFDMYLRMPIWGKGNHQEILALIIRSLKGNYNTAAISIGTANVLNRFYEGGGCPLDTVPEANYQPPLYVDAKALLAAQ